jgi:hypothetical protein
VSELTADETPNPKMLDVEKLRAFQANDETSYQELGKKSYTAKKTILEGADLGAVPKAIIQVTKTQTPIRDKKVPIAQILDAVQYNGANKEQEVVKALKVLEKIGQLRIVDGSVFLPTKNNIVKINTGIEDVDIHVTPYFNMTHPAEDSVAINRTQAHQLLHQELGLDVQRLVDNGILHFTNDGPNGIPGMATRQGKIYLNLDNVPKGLNGQPPAIAAAFLHEIGHDASTGVFPYYMGKALDGINKTIDMLGRKGDVLAEKSGVIASFSADPKHERVPAYLHLLEMHKKGSGLFNRIGAMAQIKLKDVLGINVRVTPATVRELARMHVRQLAAEPMLSMIKDSYSDPVARDYLKTIVRNPCQ